LLVPPGNADALAAAMQNLVDDPALRVRMGAAGKRKVVEFQAGTVISQIENLYTELVCGKLRAPHMSHEIQHAA
jgi:glycosyltransferase involved in cell wall biosynthesis